MVNGNPKAVRTAITARNKEETERLLFVLNGLGFTNNQVFDDPRATYEDAKRKQYGIFLTAQSFPDMTGLTMIQALRATGNYGLESHMILVDQLDEPMMVVMSEHNIKYVVTMPHTSDRIAEKLTSLWQEEANPTRVEIKYREAHAALQSGLHEMALSLGLQLLKEEKASEKTLLFLGDVYLALKQPAEAHKFYHKAHELYPDSYVPAHKTAKTLMKEKKYDEAVVILDKLATLSPLNIEILENAGLTNFEIKRHAQAKKVLTKLHSLDSKSRVANDLLAKVAIHEGNYKAAFTYLQATHDPESQIKVLKEAAEKFREQKSFLRAIDLYLQGLADLPRHPLAHVLAYQLGLLYLEIFDEDQARQYLQKSLALKPDFNEARVALDIFNQKSRA